MKKLLIPLLCMALAALAACTRSPGAADPAPLPTDGGAGAPGFTAQYIRTDGYHEGVDYPVVTVISSRAELDAYYEANKGLYDLSHKDRVYSDTTIGFVDAIEGYDEAWFALHQLVIVLLEQGSGSIRHEVESVAAGDAPGIGIRVIVPDMGTCEMAEWHILIEVAAGTFEPGAGIPVSFYK